MNHKFTPIPSELFSYHAPTQTFTADASDLNGYDFLQRAYENHSQRGFSMKSKKTGKELAFYLVSETTANREIQGWEFTSEWQDLDSGKTFHVHILND